MLQLPELPGTDEAPQPAPVPLPDLVMPESVAPAGTSEVAAGPDPMPLIVAALLALAAAVLILLIIGQPWRQRDARRTGVGWIVAVGVGFLLGCWWLDLKFQREGAYHFLTLAWQMHDARARFLFLLMPSVILIELFAVWLAPPSWLTWLARAAIAAGAGRLLLHESVYLNGVGPEAWSTSDIWRNLGLMALGLAALWASLTWLATRAPSRAHAWSLAVACGGTAVAVIVGDFSAGQLGCPLTGALIGCAAASLFFRGPFEVNVWIGPVVVGLFALLVLGCFYGSLPRTSALVLAAAPLLGWLVELVPASWIKGWPREVLRVVAVAIPVGIVAIPAALEAMKELAGG